MSSSSPRFSTSGFRLQAPKGAKSLEVIFAPTRSFISKSTLKGAGLEGIEPSSGDSLSASFRWDQALQKSTRLGLSVEFHGEGPQLFFFRWGPLPRSPAPEDLPQDAPEEPPGDSPRERPGAATDDEVDITATAPIDEVKEAIYEDLASKREALAQTDPGHAFFYELDRQTLDEFLKLDASVSEAHRSYRLKAFACLSREMTDRLWTRHSGALPDETADQDVDLLEYFSTIFWDATDELFGAWPPASLGERVKAVGLALEAFAAGQLQTWVKFANPNLKNVLVSDPDSFFMFFFSEFASMVINHSQKADHVAKWTALWPWTVSMQRFYVARFLDENGDSKLKEVDDAKDPIPGLPQQVFEDLKLEVTEGDLNVRVHENLKKLGNKFGIVPPSDSSCKNLQLPAP